MKYSEFRPTQFDQHIDLDDRENWLVLPVAINRDTEDPIPLSNWRVAISELKQENIKHEIHRFGHWGPGWFEIIIVHPKHAAFVDDDDMESALADFGPKYHGTVNTQTKNMIAKRRMEVNRTARINQIYYAQLQNDINANRAKRIEIAKRRQPFNGMRIVF